MFQVDADTRKKALETFGKTEEAANKDVQCIKNWAKNQTHFPEIMGDIEILNFLQLNKFNMERTKEKINYYYTARKQMPEFFTFSNPESLQETSYFFAYPKLFEGHSRVWFCKMIKSDVFPPAEAIKLFLNVLELRLHEDCMVTDTFICDMEYMTFRDVIKLSPKLMYKFISVYKNVWSLRLKAAHFINSPLYISIWVAIFKMFLKQKIVQRIHVYRDAEVMNELFTKEDLPKDYNGTGPSLAVWTEMMKQKLVENEYAVQNDSPCSNI